MITYLSIINLATIQHLEIDLQSGLSVLTGETGAGKSILIDAINLILGVRSDTTLIRTNENYCSVSAIFSLANNQKAEQWLKDNHFDNTECVISRKVSLNGSNKILINGQLTSQKTLNELGAYLVTIHSQHAYFSLLSNDSQRQLVDDFGQLEEQLKVCNQSYMTYKELLIEKEQLEGLTNRQETLDFLRFQLEELRAFSPKIDEYNAINKQHHLLADIEGSNRDTQEVLNLLKNNDLNVIDNLNLSIGLLSKHSKNESSLSNAVQLLQDAETYVNEVSGYISSYVDKIEFNEENHESIEERLSKWHHLARKHRILPEELYTKYNQLEERLNNLEHSEEKKIILAEQMTKTLTQWKTEAEKLTQQRKQVALQLQNKVQECFSFLHMEKAIIIIDISNEKNSEIDPKINGQDTVTILFSANVDMLPRSMAKIASGGELSRVALAIAVTTSQVATVPTLIFDEVDVGIGGATAEAVGRLLLRLANEQQVLSITHQAQVAALANQHLKVKKSLNENQTSTKITQLDSEQQTHEIARMIGGLTITQATLNHAKELLTL